MGSLFGQVWLWSLLSFVAGVALTWLVLVRPAKREVAELEERLLTAPRPTPVPAARPDFDDWPAESRSPVDDLLGDEQPRYDVANLKLDRHDELLEELDDEHRPLSDFEERPGYEVRPEVAGYEERPEYQDERPRSLFERLSPDGAEAAPQYPEHLTAHADDEPELPAEQTRVLPPAVPVAEAAPPQPEPTAPPEVTAFQPREVWREDSADAPEAYGEGTEPERAAAEQTTLIPATALAEAIAEVDGRAEEPAEPRNTWHTEDPQPAWHADGSQLWPDRDLTGEYPVIRAEVDGLPESLDTGLHHAEVRDPEPVEPTSRHAEPEPFDAPNQSAPPTEFMSPVSSELFAEPAEDSAPADEPVAETDHAEEAHGADSASPAHEAPPAPAASAFEPAYDAEPDVSVFEPKLQPGQPAPAHEAEPAVSAYEPGPAHGADSADFEVPFQPDPASPAFDPNYVSDLGGQSSQPTHDDDQAAALFADAFREPPRAEPQRIEPRSEPQRPEKHVEPRAEKAAKGKSEGHREPSRPRSLFEPLLTPEDIDDEPPAPPKPVAPSNEQPFVPTLAPELLASPGGLPQRPVRPANAPRTAAPTPLSPEPISRPQSRPVRPRPVGFSPSTGGRPANGGTTTRYQQPEGFNPRSPFGPGSVLPKSDGMAPAPDFQVKATLTGRRYFTDESANFRETRADVWFRTTSDAEKAGFRLAP